MTCTIVQDERMRLARIQVDRFWSHVDKTSDCWLWTGRADRDGYGEFVVNAKGRRNGRPVQKHMRAHRLAWELEHGPVEHGLVVMHLCDTPACVRPSHLSIGTQRDNVRDCATKGRIAKGDRHASVTRPECVRRGEDHHNASITSKDVREIRARIALGDSPTAISTSMGINRSIVYSIKYGRSWRSVPAGDAPCS